KPPQHPGDPLFDPHQPQAARMTSVLRELALSVDEGKAKDFARAHAIDLLPGEQIVLVARSTPGQVQALRSDIVAMGGKIRNESDEWLLAAVPIQKLRRLADDENLGTADVESKIAPQLNNQGVAVIQANNWQAAGRTGKGRKIGIIDSSFG